MAKYAHITSVPEGPAELWFKEKLVGMKIPLISGFIQEHSGYSPIDEEEQICFVSTADLANSCLRHPDGERMYAHFQEVFGMYALVLSFNLSECDILDF